MEGMSVILKPKRWYGREVDGVDIPTLKLPAAPYIVKPLLLRGESLLIHGPQQCGKSTFTWNMAKAIGAGEKFLGLDTTKGQVLYLETDVQLETALPRLQTLGAMPGVTFHFLPTCNLLAPHPALLETLQYYQRALKPDVVVINTLRKSYSGDSKDDEIPTKVLGALRGYFPQAAFCLNHHDTKRKFTDKGLEVGAQEEAFAGSKAWLNDIASSIHILPEQTDDDGPAVSRVLHNKNQAGLTLKPFKILLPDGGNLGVEWPGSYLEARVKAEFPAALAAGEAGAEFDARMAKELGGPWTRYRDLRAKLGLSFPKVRAK